MNQLYVSIWRMALRSLFFSGVNILSQCSVDVGKVTLLEIEFQIIVPLCQRESLPISFLGLFSTSCLDRRESYFVAFTENNFVICAGPA